MQGSYYKPWLLQALINDVAPLKRVILMVVRHSNRTGKMHRGMRCRSSRYSLWTQASEQAGDRCPPLLNQKMSPGSTSHLLLINIPGRLAVAVATKRNETKHVTTVFNGKKRRWKQQAAASKSGTHEEHEVQREAASSVL